jgi:hypothetical protein
MVMQTMLLHKERPQIKRVGAVVSFSLRGKLGKLFPVFRFENKNPPNHEGALIESPWFRGQRFLTRAPGHKLIEPSGLRQILPPSAQSQEY